MGICSYGPNVVSHKRHTLYIYTPAARTMLKIILILMQRGLNKIAWCFPIQILEKMFVFDLNFTKVCSKVPIDIQSAMVQVRFGAEITSMWTNACFLSMGLQGTNVSVIFRETEYLPSRKLILKCCLEMLANSFRVQNVNVKLTVRRGASLFMKHCCDIWHLTL